MKEARGDGAMLDGMVVVVTGASTGIGRAIAIAAARAGSDVAITYRTSEREAGEVGSEIAVLGRRARSFRLDLADAGAITEFATAVRDSLGRVDVWINNAGADILTGEGAALSTQEKLDRLLTVDLRGTMLASWEAAKLMRDQPGGGVIINMSWDHALTGMPGRNPEMFSAVKGGIMSFSKSLARSVAPAVRVNILAPGWVETAFGAGLDAEHYRRIAETTPLERWGTPEDVANVAVFLASRNASFLTGQTFFINGGVVM